MNRQNGRYVIKISVNALWNIHVKIEFLQSNTKAHMTRNCNSHKTQVTLFVNMVLLIAKIECYINYCNSVTYMTKLTH